MADAIRVLHVEDDPDFAALTADVLQREDDRLEIDHAQSVREGRQRLDDGEFDCVLSDYDMPEQNGIEFLETVRESAPDLPFILFTGKGSEEVASDAIFAGVTDYLQKESGVDQFAILANRIANAVEGHRSQQTLTERNQELRIYERIFNTMRGGACLYDREGRFQIVNDYLVDFYGTPRDELEGRPSGLVANIRDEDDGDPYRELLDGERDVLQGEVVMDGPDGDEATIEYRFTSLSIDGTVEGVVAVARDVTDRKERERRLTEFASVVSHDLRNPLEVAEGRLELAREECASDHLEDVARAHDRMGELIDDLLTLARDEGRLRDTEVVDVETLAEDCWQTVETGDATLVTDALPSIRADRSRLQQLIENLVRNAVEHGSTSPPSHAQEDAVEHGGEDVTVTVGELTDGFYVEDDGQGISPDVREGLFERDGPVQDERVGLGLSIVEQVVDGHDWSIDVTEGTDGGARFEVTDVEFVEGD